MNKKIAQIVLACACAVVCVSTPAFANLVIVSTVGGQPAAGVNYVTFDALGLGSGGGFAANTAGSLNPGGGINVSFSTNAQVVQGSASGFYAAPFLSNNNGTNFGGQANGVDATRYITSGSTGSIATASATLQFSSGQMYLGLLWGSVDLYNRLEFFNGNTSVGVISGGQINPSATGDQGVNGTFYVNINSDQVFDRVVATSTQYAFEFDNVAYSEGMLVPEPGSLAVWGLVCGIGLIAGRRRRS